MSYRVRISRLRHFAADDSGAFIGFSLFMVIGLLIAVAVGVDYMRAEQERARMQAALDNAVLAAANLSETRPPRDVVQDYLTRANVEVDPADITVIENLYGRTVTADADTMMDTMLLKLIGQNGIDVATGSGAREAATNVEISLTLDHSGSMRFGNRIAELRVAAKNFVDSVIDENNPGRVVVNVIPYAGQTNPGPEMFEYLGGTRVQTDYFPTSQKDISNVVFHFDHNGDDEPDQTVKVEGFPEQTGELEVYKDLDNYAAQWLTQMVAADSSLSGATVLGATIKAGKDPFFYAVAENDNGNAPEDDASEDLLDFNNVGRTYQFNAFSYTQASCIEMPVAELDDLGLPADGAYQDVSRFMNWDIAWNVMDWGWCPTDDNSILYAETDAEALKSFIDGLRMHDGTGTHYAMKYALALLDPDSSGAFAHLADAGVIDASLANRPLAWDEPDSMKYVVLMTDGKITDQFRPKARNALENALTELQFRDGSDRESFTSRSTNLAAFYQTCQLAKDNGVTVFTIAYEAPEGASAEMRTCATSESHFFEASQTNIDSVFSSIAVKINDLRLIQ